MGQPHPIILALLLVFFSCKNSTTTKVEKEHQKAENLEIAKPKVSITFDDGSTVNRGGFQFEEWNSMILSHLEKENLTAVFFVTGKNKLDDKGQFLLKSWDDEGHKIGNHSFSHPNFNSDKNDALLFEKELRRTDTIISGLSNAIKLFRFPYLKEGREPAKADSIRIILAQNNYTNGYVTIDASDWFVDQRLLKRIGEHGFEKTQVSKFRDFYIAHIMERASYYEKLSYEIHGRHISHTLLLHHNLTSALFLGDLLSAFKERGWELIDADEAYRDKVFREIPASNFAGESLIYSLAKQSGNYDQTLRYPAEDSRYERKKMEELGL
ncbi:MAG: polysaccharide deacetylase family protein [Flavobacteriaceae bacterium]